jgi:hypothetical protein
MGKGIGHEKAFGLDQCWIPEDHTSGSGGAWFDPGGAKILRGFSYLSHDGELFAGSWL